MKFELGDKVMEDPDNLSGWDNADMIGVVLGVEKRNGGWETVRVLFEHDIMPYPYSPYELLLVSRNTPS